MTDLEEIVSKIRRVRSQGEKPVIYKFLGLPLNSPSCEVCGKVARQGVNQCPYCGRFVGRA